MPQTRALILLAGGHGRRLGGPHKPVLPVSGTPMLTRVLDATADLSPRVVVAPAALDLPPNVIRSLESPPGAGPVAATAAGLTALRATGKTPARLALLAADLPLLTAEAVHILFAALESSDVDGVCFQDHDGRRQLLCGVWKTQPLHRALADLAREKGTLDNAAMRALAARLTVADVTWPAGTPPPWFDCDTPEDLARAETWTSQDR